MNHIVVFSSILAAVCGYALWRGGAPEKVAAVTMVVAAAISFVLPFHSGITFYTVNRALLWVDVLLFLALSLLALFANRFWPLWIAAIQLLTVGIHLAKGYDPSLIWWMYNIASGKIAYPMVAMLAIGTWRHRERVQRFGDDPSWSGTEEAA